MYVRLPGGRLVPCIFATSFASRLKGLLGTSRDALTGGAILLDPCASVHTIGMAYPIDVAFLDADNRVVKAVEGLVPGRLANARGSTSVLERASDGLSWFRAGDKIEFFTDCTQFKFSQK